MIFQSSPSMQRETISSRTTILAWDISILSLYAEGDKLQVHIKILFFYFNPLPLCRGRRSVEPYCESRAKISILSLYAEGDAEIVPSVQTSRENFNPLPLCRGRLHKSGVFEDSKGHFNPLPLCRGRPNSANEPCQATVFQSSPSMQRETYVWYTIKRAKSISILSLYAEGDVIASPVLIVTVNFNPLPLCRGRPSWDKSRAKSRSFQSSPSMQRETTKSGRFLFWKDISILSLYAEGDRMYACIYVGYCSFQSSPSMQRETNNINAVGIVILYFNPLPLCRGRLRVPKFMRSEVVFQSSPSMQRETILSRWLMLLTTYFNPLPLCRGRLFWCLQILRTCEISILSLYAEGDVGFGAVSICSANFNPLPLCRGRHVYIYSSW